MIFDKTLLRLIFFYFLDEYRLNNFILDNYKILCYTLVTVKKGDIKNDFYHKGKQRQLFFFY